MKNCCESAEINRAGYCRSLRAIAVDSEEMEWRSRIQAIALLTKMFL